MSNKHNCHLEGKSTRSELPRRDLQFFGMFGVLPPKLFTHICNWLFHTTFTVPPCAHALRMNFITEPWVWSTAAATSASFGPFNKTPKPAVAAAGGDRHCRPASFCSVREMQMLCGQATNTGTGSKHTHVIFDHWAHAPDIPRRRRKEGGGGKVGHPAGWYWASKGLAPPGQGFPDSWVFSFLTKPRDAAIPDLDFTCPKTRDKRQAYGEMVSPSPLSPPPICVRGLLRISTRWGSIKVPGGRDFVGGNVR